MMKILINKLFITSIVCCISINLFAQGIIKMPLVSNAVMEEKWQEIKNNPVQPTRQLIPDTLSLDPAKGILDDFSYNGPYPDARLWLDSFVYINNTYPYAPPTIGVATFDGLNKDGYPYDFTAPINSSRIADYLTSKPIDLNYSASDSIYLSFFYQPQGRGDYPALRDSLVLEFKEPDDSLWYSVWRKEGSELLFKDTLKWEIAMIAITDAKFLKKGFQFRFKNYATVSGSFDHWHIDYVYLNRFRDNANTVFDEVAYVYNHPPLIKEYYAMPWRQYTSDFAKPEFTILTRNNREGPSNLFFNYKLYDPSGTVVFDSSGANNVSPFKDNGYYKGVVGMKYKIPNLTKEAGFKVITYFDTNPDIEKRNDTLKYEQKFGDYFAYDDGTAESAYGFTVPDAQLAVKYQLNIPDTLRYIDIYFNPRLMDVSPYTFKLMVWSGNNNLPGTLLATSKNYSPRFSKQGINGIIRYGLDTPLPLPAGDFYVGFQQNSNINLGIGVDLNTNNQLNTFYKIEKDEDWNIVPYLGTPILRPVFGKDSVIISVKEYAAKQTIKLYPNPANSELHLYSLNDDEQQFTYTIFDAYGKYIESKKAQFPATLNIATLTEGIYFIYLVSDKDATQHAVLKFIKAE